MVRLKEILAAVAVIVSLVAMPFVVGWYHNDYVLGRYPEGTKVITVYGMMEGGTWTLEKVDGSNYWWKKFKPGTIYLQEGDKVVLRLQSTDVDHQFYAPQLNLGPISVEPGHIVEVQFEADTSGAYQYYCTTMCGDCHFYMQGWIVVTGKRETPVEPRLILCPHKFKQPVKDDIVARGNYLYRKNACISCHGKDGKGGVKNINYAKKTVPALNTLAEKMFIEYKEDAEYIIELLQEGVNIVNMHPPLDIPAAGRVLAQYEAVREVIKNGSLAAKEHPEGPEPPLHMLSWEARLADKDIDAIISYLLTLYPWEEE